MKQTKPFPIDDVKIAGLMAAAFNQATFSPDPSTQNGAIVIDEDLRPIGIGFNAFPSGVEYRDERWERPLKYSYIEHAERSAIFDAAYDGYATRNTTMICPWAACADCARAICCSGISRLIRLPFPMDGTGESWRSSCEIGDIIMQESGVEIVEWEHVDMLREIPEIRRDGKLWLPK
jgi:dCMP deaminase